MVDPLGRDSQGGDVRGERLGHHADRPGAGRGPRLRGARRARHGAATGDPGLARRRAHEVLEEEPVRGAEALPGEPGEDAARQAGDHAEDRVGTVEPEAGQEPGEPERPLVQGPPRGRLRRRDVVGGPDHRHAVQSLGRQEAAGRAAHEPPAGVAGQAGDDGDLVAARRQVLREPGRVRADPGGLRAVVDPDDEDAHPVSPPRGDQPRLSASGADAPCGPGFAAASAPYAP